VAFSCKSRLCPTCWARRMAPAAAHLVDRVLNVSPHGHSVVPDGLFVPGPHPASPLSFVPLPPPTDADLARLTSRVATRITALAAQRGLDAADLTPSVTDEDANLKLAFSQAQLAPTAPAAWADPAPPAPTITKPLCAKHGGFTLHAARTVDADDRLGLEQLCRYGLRAPFALERFSRSPDGQVTYHLPHS
ncbi:MAG: transposase zinc-binding domain-containing protein, partial [Armatimonadetes bacterium]|nr:transposase zinc-binding domain-containing protein [Armatimonadota bacterium]